MEGRSEALGRIQWHLATVVSQKVHYHKDGYFARLHSNFFIYNIYM